MTAPVVGSEVQTASWRISSVTFACLHISTQDKISRNPSQQLPDSVTHRFQLRTTTSKSLFRLPDFSVERRRGGSGPDSICGDPVQLLSAD